MLQEQFFYRLLLIIGFGIIYVKTMMKMAKYRPADNAKSTNVVLKVLGVFFIFLAVVLAVTGVHFITQIDHPTQMIVSTPNLNQFVRSSSKHIVWGYLTTAQLQVVIMMSDVMFSLGLAAYFLFYCKSATTWWKKVLKFVFAVLLCASYFPATDFHYFDFWEWIAPGLFGIMVIYVELREKKTFRMKVATPQEVFENHQIKVPDKTYSEKIQEDESRFMPRTISGNVTESEDIFSRTLKRR